MRRTGFLLAAGIVLALLVYVQADALAQKKDADPYPNCKECDIGGEKVNLVKTGQAIRKKAIFNIYSVACYVQDGAKIRSAEEMVETDCPKMLHLIMLRPVTGKSMAERLVTTFRQNHPAPAFDSEIKMLWGMMIAGNADLGDQFLITHIPKTGLHYRRVGGEEVHIRNVAFSKAIWQNYFGKHNAGDDVKNGLVSLLTK